MSERRRILLYGNSVVLGGIAASLLTEERFEVIRLPQALLRASDAEALAPDVIVFDTESCCSTTLFSALESRPNLLLLGVSPDKNVVRLWSGQEHRELSISDLTALIGADSSRAPSADGLFDPEQKGLNDEAEHLCYHPEGTLL